jgi:hypothetical protein
MNGLGGQRSAVVQSVSGDAHRQHSWFVRLSSQEQSSNSCLWGRMPLGIRALSAAASLLIWLERMVLELLGPSADGVMAAIR